MIKKILLTLLVFVTFSPIYALVGAGFHWGFDFTTTMDDANNEHVMIDELKDIEEALDTGLIYISRTNFDKTPINFGGKVILDILPVDFEVSMNFGLWQYDGKIKYANNYDTANGSVGYKTVNVSTKDITGKNYFGIGNTPYSKLNFDFTVRKTFKKVPIIKPSIGGGISAHFATPVLSNALLQKVLGTELDLDDILGGDVMDEILDEIMDGAKKPKTGMHLLVGLMIKPPVIPFAVYVDGKYMIMFNDIEDNVEMHTGGFLLNTGIMLKF